MVMDILPILKSSVVDFEVDLSKGWTVGYQYNDVNIDLVGRDSISSQEKKVHGLFSHIIW
jgi:hypothetical protein